MAESDAQRLAASLEEQLQNNPEGIDPHLFDVAADAFEEAGSPGANVIRAMKKLLAAKGQLQEGEAVPTQVDPPEDQQPDSGPADLASLTPPHETAAHVPANVEPRSMRRRYWGGGLITAGVLVLLARLMMNREQPVTVSSGDRDKTTLVKPGTRFIGDVADRQQEMEDKFAEQMNSPPQRYVPIRQRFTGISEIEVTTQLNQRGVRFMGDDSIQWRDERPWSEKHGTVQTFHPLARQQTAYEHRFHRGNDIYVERIGWTEGQPGRRYHYRSTLVVPKIVVGDVRGPSFENALDFIDDGSEEAPWFTREFAWPPQGDPHSFVDKVAQGNILSYILAACVHRKVDHFTVGVRCEGVTLREAERVLDGFWKGAWLSMRNHLSGKPITVSIQGGNDNIYTVSTTTQYSGTNSVLINGNGELYRPKER